ncbi:MAG: IS66 family transposase zinc-finger binding domain-containing protein [Chloroflexi bacterium]|nr:IS66 family transposase zinc-finger binding domain-containing protein [Chloroflexota bacterium]MBN9397531.1 IS66 family transposase zinc-finger binding domain-containing protein [Candidatus Melainabacteria bacterium]
MEAVDEVIEIYPHECDQCLSPLRASDQLGEPLRHQVWELPQGKASVTEYQFFSRQCSGCNHLTKSEKHWPQLCGAYTSRPARSNSIRAHRPAI